jgi:hypothetical protein
MAKVEFKPPSAFSIGFFLMTLSPVGSLLFTRNYKAILSASMQFGGKQNGGYRMQVMRTQIPRRLT